MKQITIIVTLAALIALFAYANLRFINPSAALEPIDVGTFEIHNTTNQDLTGYAEFIRTSPFVRAISINESFTQIGVSYEFNKLPESELMKLMSWNGSLQVSKRIFAEASGPQCPVHAAEAFWNKTLNAFRIAK